MESLYVKAFLREGEEPVPMMLGLHEGEVVSLLPCAEQHDREPLYLSDGFIDSHAHVYDGATDLGISADRIGYQTGVHLVVDAGSAGAVNFPCFRDYVMPAHETPVLAFLNIARIGLVTKQPYAELRVVDVEAALRCIEADGGRRILGVKVLSSGLIVEDAGLAPLRAGVQAARECGLPVMVHFAEGPPANEDTMALLGKGDIITHCFHGAPALAANRRAVGALNPAYCSLANVMWREDGTPTPPLAAALERGAVLDVGHGAGSFDSEVARRAISGGLRNFSISTDAHIRNINGPVHSLPHTMSKFLSLGMALGEVVASVTHIPARQLGLRGWCGQPMRRATLFSLRPRGEEEPPFVDATGRLLDVRQVIRPVAVIRDGRWTACSELEK